MATSDEVVRRNQAVSLLREGKALECIESLNDLLRDNPNDHQAYTCLGAACSQQMQWDNAISAFARALSLNPCCKSHYNLGLAYERCGRFQDASIHFQSATALDPSYQPAGESLARVRAMMAAPPPIEHQDPVEAVADDPQPSFSEEPVAEAPPVDPGTSPVWAEAQGLDFSAAEAKMSRQAGGEALEKVLTREQMDIERAAKDAEMRKRMTRSGLIYGSGIGAFVYVSIFFCMQVMGFSALLFKFSSGYGFFFLIGILALVGAAIGASVGFAVGYTSGGESTGMKVGMIAGVVTEVVKCFIAGNANVLSLFGAVIMGAILGIIVGQLVARLVELSIGWD